jgi:hypothetical protein
MSNAILCRANAKEHRAAAAEQTLLNRRELHEQSAMSWEAMAEAAERIEQMSVVNAEAKAARK